MIDIGVIRPNKVSSSSRSIGADLNVGSVTFTLGKELLNLPIVGMYSMVWDISFDFVMSLNANKAFFIKSCCCLILFKCSCNLSRCFSYFSYFACFSFHFVYNDIDFSVPLLSMSGNFCCKFLIYSIEVRTLRLEKECIFFVLRRSSF